MGHFGSCKTVGLTYAVAGFCADLKGWARTRRRMLESWVTWNPAREPICVLITQRRFTQRSILLLQ